MAESAKNFLFEFDERFWELGYQHLCGIDEAGRGPLAGPVVAAAVILKPGHVIEGIDDSKKLSAAKRELLMHQIFRQALDFGLGQASVQEIEQHNILQATFLAMQRAVDQLTIMPDFVLVDGRDFPLFSRDGAPSTLPGMNVIGGDHLSQCIAAASILAKVHRDRLMESYALQYPDYGFEKHKGYATRQHREKILQYGPCPIHRKRFLRKLLSKQANLFE